MANVAWLRTGLLATAALMVVPETSLPAQAPNPNARAAFVKFDAPVIALAHARVIDGTGAPARENQVIVIRDGKIARGGQRGFDSDPGRRRDDRSGRPLCHAWAGDDARASVLHHGAGRVRAAWPQLLKAVSGRRRHYNAHGRKHERHHGHQPCAPHRGGRAGGPVNRRDRALLERTEHISSDAHGQDP